MLVTHMDNFYHNPEKPMPLTPHVHLLPYREAIPARFLEAR